MITKINEEIKKAMIAKDSSKRDVLRAVKSSAGLIAKELHTEISNEHVLSAINKEIKALNGTINSLSGNTAGAAAVEDARYRISILEDYLPVMMSAEEVESEVKRILDGLGEVDMRNAMKAVMAELKGKADGKLISETVKNLIK